MPSSPPLKVTNLSIGADDDCGDAEEEGKYDLGGRFADKWVEAITRKEQGPLQRSMSRMVSSKSPGKFPRKKIPRFVENKSQETCKAEHKYDLGGKFADEWVEAIALQEQGQLQRTMSRMVSSKSPDGSRLKKIPRFDEIKSQENVDVVKE